MSKIEIDNKKMWESILKQRQSSKFCDCTLVTDNTIMKALKDQGLEYKDGEIVSIEQNVPETDFGKKGELTEFEQCLKSGTNTYVEQGCRMEDWDAKQDAKDLLAIVNKEHEAELERAYKNQDAVVYKCGYEKGKEDARKQIVDDLISQEDIDEMVDNFRPSADEPIGYVYLRGIKDTLKFIKGEYV